MMDLDTISNTAEKHRERTLHPWWSLCLKLEAQDRERAAQRLDAWVEGGIPMDCLPEISSIEPSHNQRATSHQTPVADKGPAEVRLHCFGISLLDWQAHAWLQRCDLPNGFRLTDNNKAPIIGLNLESIDYWLSNPLALENLSRFAALWDPDPRRVKILRAFGIAAELLHADLPPNGWLDRSTDARDTMLTLGLPDPQSLAGKDAILVLGTAEASQMESPLAHVHEWPGFDAVHIENEDSARLLAHWLEHCSRLGIQIVRLQPTDQELQRQGFNSLSLGGRPEQLTAQFFHGALHITVLQEELQWRRGGRPAPEVAPPPAPTATPVIEWETRGSDMASASVCISLYNYQQTIITALESVKSQTQQDIELIIVDDASTDQSLETARNWLQNNHQGFKRVLLLRHGANAGLAATRNTGFQAASAEWCFVLDADNRLHPQAVEQCLRVARFAAPEIAVVHPLIQLSSKEILPIDPRKLISGLSWQQQQFKQENYIDAMALIRRSGWAAVDGYSHIEDGWEDYDFWCKLIDKGLRGILCPQPLATYVSHETSMIHSRTNRNVRRISRMLQARHPWLDLPMARDDA